MVLGSVARPHGLKGAFRVRSFAESPQSFQGLGRVWLEPRQGSGGWRKIEWIRAHPKGVLLKVEGIDDPETAALLKGAEIGADRGSLPKPDPGEFLWADLIGLMVRTGDGTRVGRVAALFETGANDVLVVQGREGEVLIPAVEAAVASVDLEAGEILLTDLEGLLPQAEGGPGSGERTD